MPVTPDFWSGRRVLLTGHTGFKGSWMSLWLEALGAEMHGLSLAPASSPALSDDLSPWSNLTSHIGDIRDADFTRKVVEEAAPEIVVHMAAQSLVPRSFSEPEETVSTNVLGTVNLLQALRNCNDLKCALIVTSDKVYRNRDHAIAFDEDAPLGGDDPYSASKAAQDIIAQSWAKSFFAHGKAVVATARAGNVIGGGDFSDDRLIPDIWRAQRDGQPVTLRFPNATRPWQHVLDLLCGYLIYMERLCGDVENAIPRSLNFGPPPGPSYTVGEITARMLAELDERREPVIAPSPLPEKTTLSVDARKAMEILKWRPLLDIDEALAHTAEWYRAFNADQEIRAYTLGQIKAYMDRL